MDRDTTRRGTAPGRAVRGGGCARAGVLCALVLLALPAGAAADEVAADGCAERLARTVQEHYEAIRDLEARFTQRSEPLALGGGAVGGAAQERSGTVVLAKPGRMRWSYEEPQPSLLVTDGKVVWMYDPLLEEAQRLPDVGGFLSGAAVQFLMGEGDLLASFRASARDCGGDPVVLDLVPREDQGYERLTLRVDPGTGEVRSSTVTDLFGNRTTVSFDAVRHDVGPDASLFTFEPPEGVDVVDLTVEGGAAGRPGGAP